MDVLWEKALKSKVFRIPLRNFKPTFLRCYTYLQVKKKSIFRKFYKQTGPLNVVNCCQFQIKKKSKINKFTRHHIIVTFNKKSDPKREILNPPIGWMTNLWGKESLSMTILARLVKLNGSRKASWRAGRVDFALQHHRKSVPEKPRYSTACSTEVN